VNPFESPTFVGELARLGTSLRLLGSSLERVASAAHEALAADDTSAAQRIVPTEEEAMRALWARLGPENRNLLAGLATTYEVGETFTIEDAATSLGMSKGSLRARFMNIGRSLTSLGAMGPDLWDVDWDPDARMNIYDWNPATHRALIRIVEG
jgi:hypothetical protein